MSVQISTDRLSLDPLRVEDADEMVDLLSDPALYVFTGGEPPTATALRARYARLVVGRSSDGAEEWLNWIVRTRPDPAPVGTVQATINEDGDRAEIAWVIGVPFQRRGYATEAARGVVSWLGSRGVRNVIAHVLPGHIASETVATRAGLAPASTFEDGERVWTGRLTPAGTRT